MVDLDKEIIMKIEYKSIFLGFALGIIGLLSVLSLLGNIETEVSISTGDTNNGLNERRSVHFFDLQSNITESELLDDMSEINNIIKRAGYDGLEYKVYKVKDSDDSENYRYYFDSTWPNDEIYEEVHDLPDYKEWNKKMKNKYADQISEEIYRKVYRIN